MKLTKKLFTAISLGLTLPVWVHAAPQVTFQGEVTTQTCQATINGKVDSTILLPTVSTSDLATAGATTGQTPFTISISECAAPTSNTAISTKFYGQSVTNDGNLANINTSANPASNVSIQLTQDADGLNPVQLNGITSVQGLTLLSGETSASHQFGARYHADGLVTPGEVTAVAEYTLGYQ